MVRKRRVKKEYIPVVFAIVLLIGLISGLVFTIQYKGPLDKEDKIDYKQEEMVVDNKNSKCNTKELEELYTIANKVEFEHERVEIVVDKGIIIDDPEQPEVDIMGPVYNLTLKNMTSDLYVKITNDYTNDVVTLNEENKTDEKYIYQTVFSDRIVTYTLEILANKYNCKDEVIRKFTFKTPIYNSYSEMTACAEDNNREFYYCQEYIEDDLPSYSEFFYQLELFRKEQGVTTTKVINHAMIEINKKKEKEERYKKIIYIAGGSIGVVVIIGIVTVILLKKRRKKDEN